MTKREVYELLMIEEADAWFEYLEATREKMPNRYDELEPWAWARLNQRLRLVRRRRAKLPPAQAAYLRRRLSRRAALTSRGVVLGRARRTFQ